MGTHPINLTTRFILELSTLAAVGIWGWKRSENWPRFLFAFGLPILLMAIWGTFAVPNDPSRSGSAPIVTPGVVRLLLEFLFFAAGIWALRDIQATNLSLLMTIIVLLHYAFSYDRILWLFEH